MASVPNRGARSRKPAIKKKPSSLSLTSFISNISQLSNTSSGSNSTVIPANPSRDKQHTPKQSTSKSGQTTRKAKKSPSMSPVEEKPNVFAFMEEDEDEHSEHNEISEHEGSTAPPPLRVKTASAEDHPDADSYHPSGDYNHQWGEEVPGSFHSDSGISVRSASPPNFSPVTPDKHQRLSGYPSPGRKRKESRRASHSSDASHASGSQILHQFEDDPDMDPEAFYSIARHRIEHSEYETGYPHRRKSRGLVPHSEHHELELESGRTGYDLVACALSSDSSASLKPIYRKFETLNNRILLYLQDEISELEENLRAVDAAITHSEQAVGLRSASRRTEAKMPTQLQWQRMELVSRSMAKLDQYNRALCSYSELSRSLDSASPDDVATYRDWLIDHAPIVNNETFFLEHPDLASIPRRRSGAASEMSAGANVVVVLATIVSFKLVPEFFSRLVIGAIVITGLLYTNAMTSGLEGDWVNVYGKQIVMYGSGILILAVAVG